MLLSELKLDEFLDLKAEYSDKDDAVIAAKKARTFNNIRYIVLKKDDIYTLVPGELYYRWSEDKKAEFEKIEQV